MNQTIIDWTERIRRDYPFKAGKVLDVGSLNVNGTVKHLFQDADYLGIDFRDGDDVDLVMNGHDIDQFQHKFDTIICMNMLEHDDNFWITLHKMREQLKQGGHMFVVIPTFGFPTHEHPQDYWRAGEDAFRDVIFKNFELLDLTTVYTKTSDDGRPINPELCGFGRKL